MSKKLSNEQLAIYYKKQWHHLKKWLRNNYTEEFNPPEMAHEVNEDLDMIQNRLKTLGWTLNFDDGKFHKMMSRTIT